MFKKYRIALFTALTSGIALWFFTVSVNGWNDTLVKKTFLSESIKGYMTPTQISAVYAKRVDVAEMSGDIKLNTTMLRLLLDHSGISFNEKEQQCPLPPCKRKGKENQVVTNDSDLEFY